MKPRRPGMYYVMIWLTGGLFWFVWPFLMARDVNSVTKDYIPKLGVLTAVYCGVLALYVGLVGFAMYLVGTATVDGGQWFQPPSSSHVTLLLFVAFWLYALPAYLVAMTAKFLDGRGRSTLRGWSSVALFIFYGISLPILQGKLNEIWKAQPAAAINPDAAP